MWPQPPERLYRGRPGLSTRRPQVAIQMSVTLSLERLLSDMACPPLPQTSLSAEVHIFIQLCPRVFVDMPLCPGSHDGMPHLFVDPDGFMS